MQYTKDMFRGLKEHDLDGVHGVVEVLNGMILDELHSAEANGESKAALAYGVLGCDMFSNFMMSLEQVNELMGEDKSAQKIRDLLLNYVNGMLRSKGTDLRVVREN